MGADFHMHLKKLKIKGTLAQKLWVQTQILWVQLHPLHLYQGGPSLLPSRYISIHDCMSEAFQP